MKFQHNDPVYDAFFQCLEHAMTTYLMPAILCPIADLDTPPDVLKEQGNTAHRKREFDVAIECYTHAIISSYLRLKPIEKSRYVVIHKIKIYCSYYNFF